MIFSYNELKIYASSIILLCICCCSIIASSCKEKSNKQYFTSNRDELTIQFYLRGKEGFAFAYFDSLFRNQQLSFYNPSDKDSTIIIHLKSHVPIELYGYSVATGLIINPGDILRLSLNSNGRLNTNLLQPKNILFDSSNVFYNTFVFGLHQNLESGYTNRWTYFQNSLNSAFNNEQQRIKGLLDSNKIDSFAYKQFVVASKITYYKHILNFIDGKSMVEDSIYKKIFARIPEIENALKNSSLFLTSDLTRTIYALHRTNEESKGINPLSIKPQLEYGIVKNEDFGKFKLAFMADWLAWAIKYHNQKLDTGIVTVANDFIKQHKNTGYAKYVDSLLQHKLNDTKIITDTLTTINGSKIVWNQLFGSKTNKLVVVDFWATWCAPCIADLPRYDSIKMLLKNKPVEFVFVNINKKKDDWIKFSRNNKSLQSNNYYLPFTSQIVQKLNITEIPLIVILKGTRIVFPNFDQPFSPTFVSQINYFLRKEKLE